MRNLLRPTRRSSLSLFDDKNKNDFDYFFIIKKYDQTMWKRLFGKQNNIRLGRWEINYDNKIIDKKICQSQDHSSCFNQFNTNSFSISSIKDVTDDKYLEPYVI